MLAAIAVLPQPPLLVPELAAGAAVETEALRAACLAAVGAVADAARDWVVVGADPGGRRTVDPGTRGSFAGYGRDVPVALAGTGTADEGPGLPLPLLVAAWAAGERADRMRGELVAPDSGTDECLALGAELAGSDDAGLLVVGDGSARHTPTAPGGFDERAEAFDAVVAAALDEPDPDALAGLDPHLAAELGAVGRAPWQVLAGAALAGGEWGPAVRHTSVPYGVAYHVAAWTRRA
ncbi:hypothetical protein [Pseudonocardia endophytica]|uniref:Catalytic LigB subunit of aromatic ring-opening dioxygenase n=1 Tax=Pseudonocardia endophytica TaxID=401976 RepID=A0A4R1HV50_PSEEN|nr:hypothetical protein [Pseudonocardia endophytica]TCK25263.1 hypothetical protein EV378_1066 [Pseudonocardia endophytica]